MRQEDVDQVKQGIVQIACVGVSASNFKKSEPGHEYNDRKKIKPKKEHWAHEHRGGYQ